MKLFRYTLALTIIFLVMFNFGNSSERWTLIENIYGKYFGVSDRVDSKNLSVLSVTPRPYLFISTDGGFNWKQILADSVVYRDYENRKGLIKYISMAFPSKDRILIGGDSGIIKISTDLGMSWKNANAPVNMSYQYNTINHLSFDETKFGIAATEKEIFRTSDSGSSWTKIELSKNSELRIIGSYLLDTNEILVEIDSCESCNNPLNIIISKDFGSTWTIYPHPASSTGKIEVINDSLLFRSCFNQTTEGYEDIIIKSTNGGVSWETVLHELSKPPSAPIIDIDFYDKNNGIAAGFKCTFYSTTDGGNTWKHETAWEEDLYPPHITTCQMPDINTAILFGMNGHIIRNDKLTSVSSKIFEKNIRIFPNPAKDYCTININNTITGSEIRIEIIDLLGNKIDSFNHNITTAVQESFSFNVESYSKGLYYVLIKYNHRIESIPLIIN